MLLASPLLLVAQAETEVRTEDGGLEYVLATLSDSQLVRVRENLVSVGDSRTRVASRFEGAYLSYGPAGVTLAGQHGTYTIASDAVRALWTRGNSWKTGALVGGAIGGVALGVYVGLVADFAACDDQGPNCSTTGAVIGGSILGFVVGAAGGGLVGGVIGLAIPKWKQRYP